MDNYIYSPKVMPYRACTSHPKAHADCHSSLIISGKSRHQPVIPVALLSSHVALDLSVLMHKMGQQLWLLWSVAVKGKEYEILGERQKMCPEQTQDTKENGR